MIRVDVPVYDCVMLEVINMLPGGDIHGHQHLIQVWCARFKRPSVVLLVLGDKTR